MTAPVLVTGATGTVGSALVPALRALDAPVRAVTRDPARPVEGAETVVADLRDPATLPAALDGVDVAFLNSPSTEDAARLQIRFAELARDHGVRRIVLMSQYAARADSPVRFLRWHAEVEDRLRGLGLAHTVLRPNLYLQALLAFADTIAAGTIAAPIGDAAVSAVDTRDIADVAAHVLTTDGHDGATYTLTGPRAVTHTDIADAVAEATGTPVTFHDVAPAEFAAQLEGYLPRWQLDGLVEDYAHYRRGEAAEVSTAVADLTGRPARDVTDFARDHAAALGRRPGAGPDGTRS
ncbi:SDR family oxidoreductase [Pseudonocardia nematodicida]|uniref:SDR family oxidoreductase n=1 Tax=Pseudonocardia nematodicida TaxID=1206997 RepID=A0ABV1KG32_9PSEU